MADRPEHDPRSPLGDERFAEIYREHRGSIIRYLRRRLGEDAAEEAAAEVFFRAFRRIGDFDAARGNGSALPWLYGFASNVVLERGRAERRRLRLIERLAQEYGRGPRAGATAGVDEDASRASRQPNRVDFTAVSLGGSWRERGLPRGIRIGTEATAARVGEGWLVIRAKSVALRNTLLGQTRVDIRDP